MTRKRQDCHHFPIRLSTVLLVILTVALPVPPLVAQEEEITVSCFKGNMEEGNYVGNVTATILENAGPACNSTYYDCQGECLGCFPDASLDRMVCFDNKLNKILK